MRDGKAQPETWTVPGSTRLGRRRQCLHFPDSGRPEPVHVPLSLLCHSGTNSPEKLGFSVPIFLSWRLPKVPRSTGSPTSPSSLWAPADPEIAKLSDLEAQFSAGMKAYPWSGLDQGK
jgi:hypothetical protein